MKSQHQLLALQGGSVLLLVLFTLPLILPGNASIGWWLMQCVPLLLVLSRLHKEARPLQWLGFLLLFYFTVGVLQVFSPSTSERWLGIVTVLCCCLLFALAIVRLRAPRPYKD